MAWLYVPGLEASNSVSNSSSARNTELWVTSSGKPMRRLLSCRAWKTRPWIRLLYGTISKPSRAARGAASWISSLRDSRASPPRRRAARKESGILVGYGRMFGESFARFDRKSGSFLKTLTASSRLTGGGRSRKFSGKWPRAGAMTSRGELFELPMSALPICASASSSSVWPTPLARDWETPSTVDAEHPRRRATDGWTAHLNDVAADLAQKHPRIFSLPNRRRGRHGGNTSGDGLVLNPWFVEAMMGWPAGWTAYGSRATGSYRSWLRTHSLRLRRILEYALEDINC